MRRKLREVAHCDGYYTDGVCSARGSIDAADIRYGKDGRILRQRHLCKGLGLSPLLDLHLCPHCIENRSVFRQPARHHTVTRLVTPFQAWTPEGMVVKAFARKGDLTKFANKHPELQRVEIMQ